MSQEYILVCFMLCVHTYTIAPGKGMCELLWFSSATLIYILTTELYISQSVQCKKSLYLCDRATNLRHSGGDHCCELLHNILCTQCTLIVMSVLVKNIFISDIEELVCRRQVTNYHILRMYIVHFEQSFNMNVTLTQTFSLYNCTQLKALPAPFWPNLSEVPMANPLGRRDKSLERSKFFLNQ